VLVIAHRLSTIRQAGEIVVLDNGRVVRRGRHDDLVDAPGLYATLYRAQQVARRWDVASSQVADDERMPQAVDYRPSRSPANATSSRLRSRYGLDGHDKRCL